jgi:hypothetical protein
MELLRIENWNYSIDNSVFYQKDEWLNVRFVGDLNQETSVR